MIRVGVVEYTNTLPLAYGLEDLLAPLDVLRAVPGRVAELLEAGALDVGLVPVATLAHHPEWPVVPGLGIASEGPVRSVLLVSRRPLEEATRLVADPASRTSNVLARLWLENYLGRSLPAEEGAPDVALRLGAGEPAVVIGDAALFLDEPAAERVDLGAAWTAWTGLPFVYAVWAGPGAGDPALSGALERCHARNASRLPELAAYAAPGDAARQRTVLAYLTRDVRHRLGPREADGLRAYLARAAAAGYLPPFRAVIDHAHAR